MVGPKVFPGCHSSVSRGYLQSLPNLINSRKLGKHGYEESNKKLLLLFLFLSLFLLVPNHITAITAGEEIFSKQEEEFVKISRKRFAVVVRNNERDDLLLLRVD